MSKFNLTDRTFATQEEKKEEVVYLPLPSITLKEIEEKADELDEKLKEAGDAVSEWIDTVKNSIDYYSKYFKYREDDYVFEQGVEMPSTGDKKVYKSIEPLKVKDTSGELKGDLALIKLAKHLGMGDIFKVPLVHSGIWVTLKPPTELDLIEFYNNFFKNKIHVGRLTSGVTLSNFSVIFNNELINFICDHIHSINYSDITKENIREYIKITDLPILIWGFANTIFPSGFDYSRSCLNGECDYVAHGKINLSKLLWVDNTTLTETQKNILSVQKPNNYTIDAYNKYQLEHKTSKSSIKVGDSDIVLTLKVPTLDEYFSDGLNWVYALDDAINKLITSDASEKQRISTIEEVIKTSSIRQYGHFIESIEFDENLITDKETLRKTLELLSSDERFTLEAITEIAKFIDKVTLAVVGIPTYTCPECGQEQVSAESNERFSDVIPLDVSNVFFTLITIRLMKIRSRMV